jgi:hypothetical protein
MAEWGGAGPCALRQFVLDALEQGGRSVLPLLNAAHRDPSRFASSTRSPTCS